MCDIRKQSLASVIDSVLKSLDPANPDGVAHGRPLDIIQMRYALANLYAYEGEMDKSIEQWQTAYEIAHAQLPGAMPELEEVLGIAYLHKSEMDNDIYRHPGDRCIFPPSREPKFCQACFLREGHRISAQVPAAQARRARRPLDAQSCLHDLRKISGRRSSAST